MIIGYIDNIAVYRSLFSDGEKDRLKSSNKTTTFDGPAVLHC